MNAIEQMTANTFILAENKCINGKYVKCSISQMFIENWNQISPQNSKCQR